MNHHVTLKGYVTGFLLSLLLTVVPWILVEHGMASRTVLVVGVVAAAVLQLVVQLGFFLHLSFKPSSRDGLLTFASTGIIIFVIVFGSLWVMHDLNYFMMDPVMEEYSGAGGTGAHGHHGHAAPSAAAAGSHGEHGSAGAPAAPHAAPMTDSVAHGGMGGHGSPAASEHHGH